MNWISGFYVAADLPPVWCLMGPTASGKTDLAIELAQRCGCELVSVDSALVYRGLDIGSAKPDYPHHLVDIRDPSETYSAADFLQDARQVCADITRRGKIPLLVGGTMLYFKAFLEGLAPMPPANADIRAGIAQLAQQQGWPAVHQALEAVDPEAAARIHPHHSQRLSRALEVYRTSGIPMSQWQRRQQQDGCWRADQHYQITQMALWPADRAVLHERIGLRLEQMFARGFVNEVQKLRDRGDLSEDLPALRAVGYRQVWEALCGQYGMDEARYKALVATRQLAKRQLTWLRKWSDLTTIYTDAQGRAYLDERAANEQNEQFSCNIVDLALKTMRGHSI